MYEDYAKTLAAVSFAFARSMGPLLRLFMASDRSPAASRDFVKAGTPIIAAARLQAHAAALDLSTKEAKRYGVDLAEWILPEPAEYKPEALAAVLARVQESDAPTATLVVARTLERHVQAAAREFVQDLADPSPDADGQIFIGDGEADFTGDILLTQAERDAAQAIVDAKLEESPEDRRERFEANWKAEQQARKDRRLARRRGDAPAPGETIPRRRIKWARILTGDDNCALCVMCASRGPVYSSKRRAAGLDEIVPIRDGSTKIREKALGRIEKIGEAYHDGCDCVAVPVFLDADFLESGTTDKLRAIWEKAQEGEAATEDGNHPLNLLRIHLAANPDLAIPQFNRQDLTLAA